MLPLLCVGPPFSILVSPIRSASVHLRYATAHAGSRMEDTSERREAGYDSYLLS